MVFIAYGLYALLLATALWRSRANAVPPYAATTMIVVPLLAAAIITWFALSTHRGPAGALAVLAPGLWLFAVSFLPFARLGPTMRQQSRIVGWSLAAGVTLVPATTVLLAPLSGLLAFPALDVFRMRQAQYPE